MPAESTERFASFDLTGLDAMAALRRSGVDVDAMARITARQELDPASETRFWLRLLEGRIWLNPFRLKWLFEVRPFRELERHLLVTDYLAHRTSPTRSRDDLGRLLERFASHLEESLDRQPGAGFPQGHPHETFEHFRWLERLSPTYPSREPMLMPWGMRARTWQSSPHYSFEYAWPAEPPPLPPLDSATAARLDSLRPSVHNFKLDAVRRLSRVTNVDGARRELQDAIARMGTMLRPRDVDLLFRVDRQFALLGEPGVGEPGTGQSGSGGLSELFTAFGHVEAEAMYGLFHVPTVELGKRFRLEPSHTERSPACNYFELHAEAAEDAATGDAEPNEWIRVRRILTDASDRFLTSQPAFWSSFTDRVNAQLVEAVGRLPKGSPPRYEPRVATLDSFLYRAHEGNVDPEGKRPGRYRRAAQRAVAGAGVTWHGRWDLIRSGADAKHAFDRLLDEEAQTTLTEVARRLGKAKSTVSGRFRTRDGVPVGYLAKLAAAVGRHVLVAFPPKGSGDGSVNPEHDRT